MRSLRLVLAAGLLAASASLEAVQSPIKLIQVANDLSDAAGNRLNQARVTIVFRQPIRAVAGNAARRLRVTAPTIDPLNVDPTALKPFQNLPAGTRDANVLKVELAANDPTRLILTTEGKLPKGTKLEIPGDLITFKNGQKLPRSQQVTTEGLTVAAASADNGPFRATNLSMVTRAAYPNAPPNDKPVSTPPFVPEERVLDHLRYVAARGRFDFVQAGALLKEMGEPAAIIDAMVSGKDVAGLVSRAWNNARLRFSFSSPNLRAGAIASLDVEILGGVLRAYALGQNQTRLPLRVELDTAADPIRGVATSFISGQGRVVINDVFGGEDPRSLFCVASHEICHQDANGNSHYEERIARTIETVCWEIGTNRDARIFAVPHEMTPLVRSFNDHGIAFHHSGRKGVPGYHEADQIGAAPAMVFRGGNEEIGSLGEYFDRTIGGAPLPPGVTPTNRAVDEFLRVWSKLPANLPLPSNFPKQFGPAWIHWFERGNRTLGGEDRMLAFGKYDLTSGS